MRMMSSSPEARFVAMLTAWSRTDPLWTIWNNDDQVMAAAEGAAVLKRDSQ
jgi:hypothetical protein